MILDYKLVVSDEIDLTNYGKERVDLAKRIYPKVNIDGIEKDVTISCLKLLISRIDKEIKELQDNIKSELLNYASDKGYSVSRVHVFDYDSDICVCVVCNK